MQALLQTRNLSKTFGGVKAVQNFAMQVLPGQAVGIIGPNGAGKTTIFNLISGITPPSAGEVWFAGQNVTGRPSYEIALLGMSRTFQTIRLFKGLSVLENVKVACGLQRPPYGLLDALLLTRRFFRGEAELHRRAMESLELVGLSHLQQERAENLPYGLQRRLEIARALATRPSLLLLDEPAAGLNPSEVQDLIGLIRSLQQRLSLSLVLIEHHIEVILDLCDWVYVLQFGQSIAEGKPEAVRWDPRVLAAYLGEEVAPSA